MTPAELAEVTWRLLGYTDQDKKPDDRLIVFAADKIRGSQIPSYANTYGSSSLQLFCRTEVLPLLYDAVRDRKYVQLPYSILGMSKNMGLVQVSKVQEEERSFVALQNGMLSVYANLEAGGAAGKTIYWLEGNKIFLKSPPPYATDILIKAIPSFSSVGWDEQIPQPYEFDGILIQGVKAELQEQKMTPDDKVNDNITQPLR